MLPIIHAIVDIPESISLYFFDDTDIVSDSPLVYLGYVFEHVPADVCKSTLSPVRLIMLIYFLYGEVCNLFNSNVIGY